MKSTLGTLFCFLVLGIFLMTSTGKAQAGRNASALSVGTAIHQMNGN